MSSEFLKHVVDRHSASSSAGGTCQKLNEADKKKVSEDVLPGWQRSEATQCYPSVNDNVKG